MESITNIAADTLNNHPDHQSRKMKFVHFSEQCSFLLVSIRVDYSRDMIVPKFERTVQPTHCCMTKNKNCKKSRHVDTPSKHILMNV